MNDTAYWGTNGMSCSFTQSVFSNSAFAGSSTPKITPSKGNPTFKSNPLEAPLNTGWPTFGQPAIGNPLNTANYYPGFKWGEKSGINNKWSAGTTDTEKGRLYEGE